TTLLPADDGSYGFDNIAGVLKISPSLMERYITAARKISRLAVGDPPRTPAAETFRVPPELKQDTHVDGLPFGTRGGTAVTYTFPSDGDYEIRVALGRAVWEQYPIVGLTDEAHEMEVSIDGERVALFPVKRPAGTRGTPGYESMPSDPEAGLHVRVPARAGPHAVVVTFLEKDSALVEEDLREPFHKPYVGQVYEPLVGSITITGPFAAAEATAHQTPSRDRIFVCRPARPSDEEPCAKRILSTLARRAYRRPSTDADVQELLTFYRQGRPDGGFDAGIELALRKVLVSPEFLFRIERDPLQTVAGDGPAETIGAVYPVSDLELASRLSFFLWSTIPDDRLLQVASEGRLHEPAVLDVQVRRMLADSKSDALVKNFLGQWLYLRNLRASRPDEVVFPDFDEDLRDAFQRETELFFANLIREDRSVLELLKADYTFVNERLAQFYGLPGVYGDQFRRVALPAGSPRGGLLGEGSILTVTSYANRTSPVVRGKWLLENILGTPPPPPPPNVPPLDATNNKGGTLTVRERMEEHRKNPACASCHKLMDPLGFAL